MGVLVYVLGLAILWVVVTIPVYFAARVIKGDTVGFGDAMGATLGGVVVYYVVYFAVTLALGAVIGAPAGAIALLLGLLAWLAVFRGAFRTTWPKSVGIAVLAWVILLILDAIMVTLFGVTFPAFYPF
ncbi:MAG: hypothetical protein JRN21_07420 [Nitrososphaerota archaeon]|nr:hypothetical protein [Nitrososphaerota archaeon]